MCECQHFMEGVVLLPADFKKIPAVYINKTGCYCVSGVIVIYKVLLTWCVMKTLGFWSQSLTGDDSSFICNSQLDLEPSITFNDALVLPFAFT